MSSPMRKVLPWRKTSVFTMWGDFSVKKMTEQSHFLSGLNTEKQFADRMEKSLRSNKVLQRVLENPATREAFVNSLSAMLDDLKKNEKSNPANE